MKQIIVIILLILASSFISAGDMPSGGGSAQSIMCYTEDEVQQRVYDECNENIIKAMGEGRKKQQKEDQTYFIIILGLILCAFLLNWKIKKQPHYKDIYQSKPRNIGMPSLRDGQQKNIIDRIEELEKQINELKRT